MTLLFVGSLIAQEANSIKTKYGLVTLNIELYRKITAADPAMALVDLQQFIPGIHLDIKYAKKDNFLGAPVYKSAKAYLNLPAAIALKAVEEELNKKGLGLKIFDAYRPYRATVLFYEKVKDTVFVASPYRGSRHNRGSAIDLTMVRLKNGKELSMPTAFDDFTKKAHTNYPGVSPSVIANRELLKSVMIKHGFELYPDEWWHFDFPGWKNHPVLDIPFEDLE